MAKNNLVTYKKSTASNLLGLDIFAGAGGLSLGAIQAGIDVSIAIEMDKSAAETYKHNHSNAQVLCDNICDVSTEELKKTSFFIIMGGPPCQGFSLSNTRSRNLDNPKNFLFKEFVRFVKDIQPQWFLFENVGGFPLFEKGRIKDEVRKLFEELGYAVADSVLWASDYGVPQNRNRFFMVGNNQGITFEFPKPFDYKVTVEEAIGDLPVLVNGDMVKKTSYKKSLNQSSFYARQMRVGSDSATQNFVSKNADYVIERYRFIPQGGNWKSIPNELMGNYADKSRCHSGIYRRLCADKPSVVISNYRKSMLIHPTQDRGLSVREAARLQSFPDTFVFKGSLMHIQQQIGNAVPPLLAKAVFDKILSYER